MYKTVIILILSGVLTLVASTLFGIYLRDEMTLSTPDNRLAVLYSGMFLIIVIAWDFFIISFTASLKCAKNQVNQVKNDI